METCNLKIKDVDSSMKCKLIVDTSTRLSCSNTKNQKEINSSDSESVTQSENSIKMGKNKNQSKHLQNTGPWVFAEKTQEGKLESNNKAKKKNNSSEKTFSKNKNASKNSHSKSHQTNTHSIDELISKMSKFSSKSVYGPRNSNNSNDVITEDLRNIRTQAEINKYTQQLYQNILQQQCNLQNVNSQVHNMFLNQNRPSLNTPFQNSPPPPLLSLRPQINVQDFINLQKQKKMASKRK